MRADPGKRLGSHGASHSPIPILIFVVRYFARERVLRFGDGLHLSARLQDNLERGGMACGLCLPAMHDIRKATTTSRQLTTPNELVLEVHAIRIGCDLICQGYLLRFT